MDKILINNLHLQGVIGVEERERGAPHEILINVVIFTDTHAAARTDDLADTVDYDQLIQSIRILVGKVQRFTVEALAHDIAELCLHNPRVQKVTVRVEKPAAVAETESVGVEIERSN